jgi:hypothetical protein
LTLVAIQSPVLAQSPHALTEPQDFAALGLQTKMSAAEVFSAAGADKENQILWVKSGLDANCRGVQLAAENIQPGQPSKADRRAFKHVSWQSIQVVRTGVDRQSNCTIYFVGEAIRSVSCAGTDKLAGGSSVLDDFIQRIGPPDKTTEVDRGKRAEWYCGSNEAKRACKVTIEATEPICIRSNAKTACPIYRLDFERAYRAEEFAIAERAAQLHQTGCRP